MKAFTIIKPAAPCVLLVPFLTAYLARLASAVGDPAWRLKRKKIMVIISMTFANWQAFGPEHGVYVAHLCNGEPARVAAGIVVSAQMITPGGEKWYV